MAGSGIVVWEWQNEFGCWRPYEPSISSFIENNKSSSHSIKLGTIDPRLYQYEIDLQMMCQIRQGTGTQRPVRRSVHPPSSPLAKGITWQWESDIPGQWTDFDVDVMDCLEDSFTQGQFFIDLTLSRVGLPYHIDLTKMTQTRIHTGRVRKIQRVFTSASYPLDLSTGSSISNKRNHLMASGQNKNITAKKPKIVSGSVRSMPASTSGVFASNTGISFPSSSSSVLHNGFSAPMFPSNSTPNSTSSVSSVIQFGQAQGPLTRSRYNHTLAPIGMQGSASGPLPQPSQTLPPANINNNNNNPTNFGSYLPSSNYSSLPLFQGQPGFFNGLFGNQAHLSSSTGHSGYIGLPSQPVPPISHGFGSNTFGGFFPHTGLKGSFTPNPLPDGKILDRSKLKGVADDKLKLINLTSSGVPGSKRVRPSSTTRGNRSLPPSQRIPNIEKSKKRSNTSGPGSSEIIDNYAVLLSTPPADEDCCICCEKLQEASGHATGGPEDHAVIQLEKCSHMFHSLCLKAMYDSGPKEGSLQCPTCKTIYGEKRGNCPIGEMEYHMIHHELPGYEGHKTIQITYNIASGTQGPEHPHPGKRYSTRGFPRVGYIPDCDKGRKIVQLLIIAWKRRLTFTIGTSATTGEDNTVVWNEIHHKTELGTNYSGHGYPDPKYLDNVLLELAVHGITEKDLPP